MTCGTCGSTNPAEARYCVTCGAMLDLRCPSCRAMNNSLARLCGACGTPLRESRPATVSTRAPRESRRIVTVLFADIVGFTSLVESYGDQAEHIRGLLKECFDALAAVVVEHGGTVEKFIGDAICALFGAPAVHEDDPDRALACALEMQRVMALLDLERASNTEDAAINPELRIRIGVHSGEVVGGTSEHAGEEQYSVTGDAVNIAARLQAAADPGQVLVGDTTERLTRDRFEFTALGCVKLKGKRNPVEAFVLDGARAEHQTALAAGATPMVGRHREMDHLEFCMRLAAQETPQLVELVGDAGVGKSRLLTAFAERVGAGAIVCQGNCPTLAASPLFPFRTIVGELLAQCGNQLENQEGSPDAVLERLTAAAGAAEAEYSLDVIADAIHRAVVTVSEASPVAIVVENAHRADPDTLELLRLIIAKVRSGRVLLLWTRRSGEELLVEGDTAASLTRLHLGPLPRLEAGELLQQLLDTSSIAEPFHERIVARSGGNPLFLEAMVRALLEDGPVDEARLESLEIPATVQGLIQSRLDGLPESERLLLQEAAVAGQEFHVDLLERADLYGLDVRLCLDSLTSKGLLENMGDSRYRFRHVLTQEVAYETMLQALRAELHREVAEALLDLHPDGFAELAPVVADHYAKSGDTDRAVEVLVQAGTGS